VIRVGGFGKKEREEKGKSSGTVAWSGENTERKGDGKLTQERHMVYSRRNVWDGSVKGRGKGRGK